METSNLVYTLPGQPQMQVEVILASSCSGCPPIFTVRLRYPRPIHGEIMTHRVFGRNARSSRAVPVKTMLNEVKTIPYVPWHWLKNKPGMQGTERLSLDEQMEAERIWLLARDEAVRHVEHLFNPDGLNIHKQNPNRLLEPFSWIDTLITATEWQNFLWLRQHHAAEPHLQDLANLVDAALKTCKVQTLEHGEWHLPYITDEEKTQYHSDVLLKLSAARCARISYKPFNGESSIEAELARYNHLVTDERVHASPLEHQAQPDRQVEFEINRGWDNPTRTMGWEQPELHGNLTGWVQARKLVPNEVYHG